MLPRVAKQMEISRDLVRYDRRVRPLRGRVLDLHGSKKRTSLPSRISPYEKYQGRCILRSLFTRIRMWYVFSLCVCVFYVCCKLASRSFLMYHFTLIPFS